MLNSYLVDTITYKTVTRDKWGTKSTVSTTVKARVEYKTKLVRNLSGEQVVSTAQVIMKDRTIVHQDILTIDGVDRSIISITKDKDFSANKVLTVAVA